MADGNCRVFEYAESNGINLDQGNIDLGPKKMAQNDSCNDL
jgi:hypothetical protein